MIGVIRSKQFLSDNPEAREKLDGLGFELDGKAAANNQRFKTVFTALKAYKEANGDMLVPQPFVIPDGDSAYPESTWGLRLGARVNAIRSQGTFVKTDPKRRELLVSQDGEAFNLTFGRCGANHPPAPFLTPFHFVAPIVALFCAAQDEIGFVWEPPPSVSGKKRGRKKKEDLMAPLEGFVNRSITLGDLANYDTAFPQKSPSFGAQDEYEADLVKMEEMPPQDTDENMWEFDDFNGYEFEDVIEALVLFHEATNNWDIPTAFVCGEVMEREVETVAIDAAVDPGDEGKEIAESMDDLPVSMAASEDSVVQSLIAAIERGDPDFLDMEDDDDEEEKNNERGEGDVEEDDDESGKNYSASDSLEDLMGKLGVDDEEQDVVEEAGDVASPPEEEVELPPPLPDITFPLKLEGMKLGEIAKRIRIGDVLAAHDSGMRSMLDDIGFDWKEESSMFINAPFARVLAALYAYKKIRGDLCVEIDFSIPAYDPWPAVLADFPLGHYVNELRGQKILLEEAYPAKMQMLNQLNFLWLSKINL